MNIPWGIHPLESKHPDELLEIPMDDEGYYLDSEGNRVAFNGNRELKPAYTKLPLNQYHIDEIRKCSEDIKYFIFNYCKVLTKKGWAIPELRDYQEEYITRMLTENRLVLLAGRQLGKTVTSALKFIWSMNFVQDTSIGICANIEKGANEVLHKAKQTFNKLPIWLQQGVTKWNVKSIYFENGSKCITSATNGDAFRGFSFVGGIDKFDRGHSTLYIDEAAFVDNWGPFADSVLPTVSSDPNANIIVTSTPNGMNHYYDIVKDARSKRSEYNILEVPWNCLPERNEAWRENIIKTHGIVFFNQNYGCISGDSIIDIDGIGDIKIEDFYEFYTITSDESIRFVSSDLKILTPSGYQFFDGIRKLSKPSIIFTVENGASIQVSTDHVFIVNGLDIIASSLNVGDVLDTKLGLSTIISKVDGGVIDVYDPLSVKNGNAYYANNIINHNCQFIGSSATLINADTLGKLESREPIEHTDSFSIYQKPHKDTKYILLCDLASGTGGDYTVVQVVKILKNKFEQVAIFRSNTTPLLSMTNIIYSIAKKYNDAYILFEINYGSEVPNRLYYDLEYENMLTVASNGSQQILLGFKGQFRLGLQVDAKIKAMELVSLKAIIESGKLILNDHTTISEFYNFIQKGNSFEADSGRHDDTVMALALLGWLVGQESFKEIINYDFVSDYETIKAEEESDLLPPSMFGSADDSKDVSWITA